MKRHYFRAPLSHQSEKFDRSFKTPDHFKIEPENISVWLKMLYVFFLMAIDLLVFTSSGNLDIFHGGIFLSAELCIILFFLLLFSCAIFYAARKSLCIQNMICSFVTLIFIVVLFNQFYQFDPESFIGQYLESRLGGSMPSFLYVHSHIYLALIISSVFLYFISRVGVKTLAVYTFLFFVAFAGIIRHEYKTSRNVHDFVEQQADQETAQSFSQTEQKFIYIMLPNLPSYKYFDLIEDKNALQTKQLMTGFMAQNGFQIFPNAYNLEHDPFLNIVNDLNVSSTQNANEHLMQTMMLYKYWNFFNVKDEYILLKNNQIFDSFKKAGYQISAYKSRVIDLCRKNHKLNVNRCTEKLNQPVNFYTMNMTTLERTQLLLIEWLSSMKIFNHLSVLFKAMKIFTEPEKLPLIGVSYNNLYVVHSIKTFDILAEHILKDQGKQAYFVYADIPADMFVYDEFCRVKPSHAWMSKQNLPWIETDNRAAKQNAYFDQTKCLFGKLQEFINRLDENNILNQSVIIVNGISGLNNFQKRPYENFADDLFYDKLNMLAIKTPEQNVYQSHDVLCATPKILNDYLYNDKKCEDSSDISVHPSLKESIIKRLNRFELTDQQLVENADYFNAWYQDWKSLNLNDAEKLQIVHRKAIPNASDENNVGENGQQLDLQNFSFERP